MRATAAAARRIRCVVLERLENRLAPSFGPVGPEFRVNPIITGNQRTAESIRSVALDGDGDIVVAWERDSPVSPTDVYVRRYSAGGAALTGEIPVNTFTSGDQNRPAVATDADGDFVVAWHSFGQDGHDIGIYARRFDATGAPQGGEFRVNVATDFDQKEPAVAMAANGDFVIAWKSDQQSGGERGIYFRRFAADGTPRGGEVRATAFFASVDYPAIAADASGGFVVTWTDFANIIAKRYSAAGVALTGEIVVSSTSASQAYSSAAMDADGDFVIVWHADRDANTTGIYARRFDFAGAPLGSDFRVNTVSTFEQIYPSVAMDTDGDFVVSWEEGPSSLDVFARRYIGGVAQGGEFRVNSTTINYERNASVGMDSDGDFTVVWAGADTDQYGVFAQRYLDADNNGDTGRPIVGNVFVTGLSAPIFENGRVGGPVAGLTMSLSEELRTTGNESATNPANWGLLRNGVDISSQISAVNFTFAPATGRFEASLSLATPLTAGEYVAIARGTLRDITGNFLDGDFDGVGSGTDFRRRFGICPPTVSVVTVNDGAVQRSRVASLTVTFGSPVTFAGSAAAAFTLTRTGGGLVGYSTATSIVNGVTVVTLNAFTGPEAEFGSFRDGRYSLAIDSTQITAGGLQLDGDGNGTPGGNFAFGDAQGLFRYYGDMNGDRRVDISDFGFFSLAYLTPANYNAALDFNNDGRIDIADFGQFSVRFFTTLP